MVDPNLLEITILKIVSSFGADKWASLTLGNLRNRLSEADKNLTLALEAEMVGCICALEKEAAVTVRKYDNSTYIPFARERSTDEHYTTQFFYMNSFELKATHYGRKRLISWQTKGNESEAAASILAAEELDDRLPLLRIRAFDPSLERCVKEATESHSPLGLVIIDVTNSVNSTKNTAWKLEMKSSKPSPMQ